MGKTVQDIALSYDRFSDPKQAEGDSEDRQQRAFAGFIQRHQLQPAKEYSFLDRGLSGYSGKHRDKGQLGRLLKIAKTGVFKPRRGQPGYVLVIEAWDSLGRLCPDKMIDLSGTFRRRSSDAHRCLSARHTCSAVTRGEINDFLARKICRDLGITES